jgi:hypothetical protein
LITKLVVQSTLTFNYAQLSKSGHRMKTILKGLSAGVLSLASLVVLPHAPAIASSLTNASIGGSASSDYLVYGANATNTFVIPNILANVQAVLGGSAASPTGNVELSASSEKGSFDFTKNTSLSGAIGGKNITLSSLTASDWATPDYKGSGKTFGAYWFHEAFTTNVAKLSNPQQSFLLSQESNLFTAFGLAKGFQRFSDPNISYVNQNDQNGWISIGLAGHYDAAALLGLPIGKNIQASEVVKYNYEGHTGYLYSFKADKSNLSALDDGVSHTGNYEVTFQGTKPVPVPAGFVGIALAGVIGGGMIKRRKLASKA